MVIIASVFIGMSIIFYVQYVTNGLSPMLPIICIICMLVLIAFLFTVQYMNNKAEKKKATLEKENLNKTTTTTKKE
jgi:fructose-specific phosphotransferase system IIC component